MTTKASKGAGSAAHSTLLARYLHPRIIAEHVFSGGGSCMHHSIKSLVPGLRCVGRALTVRTASGFNRRVLEALAEAEKGDVLVIAGGGEAEVAVWGGMVHWNATRKGLGGIVADGMTRDLIEIRSTENTIPMFGIGQVPAIAGFGTPTSGSIGDPIICGGVQVHTGDLIYGDDDGVVVVPWAQAEAVLDLAMKSIAFDDKEQAWVESGREVADLLKMLWDPDGTQYRERKFRWAMQNSLDPLP
jgi:4-hydroxy-4-methyl-2-oxoglutarate aldolase